MIEAREIVFRSGKRPILDRVCAVAPPGEMTIIVGPNGAGKSTLLKVMTGELTPHSGQMTLDGRPVSKYPAQQLARRRAVLPQASALAFPFTVHEVVRLGAGGPLAAPQRNDRVRTALARVDLNGFGARLYQELSGGEQQRVHLARVLCQVWEPVADGEPRYLFLDEPTSSLDLKHQLVALDMARDFARSGGGVVAILHDLNLAALYADRIIVIDRGRVAVAGTPAEVVTHAVLSDVFGIRATIAQNMAGIPYLMPEASALR